jgi:hypothetical protein
MDPPRDAAVGETVTTSSSSATAPQEVRLVAPGLFAKNYGPMTPVGLVMGHVVYGLVVALVYGWLS